MNDIAKMKAEFKEKIRLAELENKYNSKLEKEGISLGIFSYDKENERYLVHFRTVNRPYDDPFNGHDAQTIMRTFPRTADIEVSVGAGKKERLPYDICTSRNPKEPRTMLKIRYIHENLEVWIDLPIDERNPELMQYFMRTQRELDSSTIGLYYGAVTPRERANLQMLPFLTFNCGHVVRFYGGTHRQISVGHLECIASSVENDDFSWERTNG